MGWETQRGRAVGEFYTQRWGTVSLLMSYLDVVGGLARNAGFLARVGALERTNP